jgi:hypothetical protein
VTDSGDSRIGGGAAAIVEPCMDMMALSGWGQRHDEAVSAQGD